MAIYLIFDGRIREEMANGGRSLKVVSRREWAIVEQCPHTNYAVTCRYTDAKPTTRNVHTHSPNICRTSFQTSPSRKKINPNPPIPQLLTPSHPSPNPFLHSFAIESQPNLNIHDSCGRAPKSGGANRKRPSEPRYEILT